jgi:four helix bundle protein
MDHKDLDVWKKSMNLVVLIYDITSKFPSDERFGLTSQMRRAAVSIPSNIAEGAARKGDKEFIQFLMIALGSLSELETQYLLSIQLKFVQKEIEVINNMVDVKKLILGFRNYLKNKIK